MGVRSLLLCGLERETISEAPRLLDHEQVELFPKRAFRCDCPTSALSVSCHLHRALEDPNDRNVYSQNFEGKFCRCGRPYNAATEKETMLQCLACEVGAVYYFSMPMYSPGAL